MPPRNKEKDQALIRSIIELLKADRKPKEIITTLGITVYEYQYVLRKLEPVDKHRYRKYIKSFVVR